MIRLQWACIYFYRDHIFSYIERNELREKKKPLASGDILKIGCVIKHLVLCGHSYEMLFSFGVLSERKIRCAYYINAILTAAAD